MLFHFVAEFQLLLSLERESCCRTVKFAICLVTARATQRMTLINSSVVRCFEIIILTFYNLMLVAANIPIICLLFCH